MRDNENEMCEDTPLLSSSVPPTRTSCSQQLVPADTGAQPAGATFCGGNDDNLAVFRRAIGINSDTGDWSRAPGMSLPDVETGRRNAVGMYRAVLQQHQYKRRLHHAVSGLVWTCHGVQIVVGAALTSLGLAAGSRTKVAITVLGAVQTMVASVLTTLRSKKLPEKLSKPEADFRELLVWIEETEALVAVGVTGKSRAEVGELVETAFAKYNACFGRSIALEGEMDRAAVSGGQQR